MWGLLFICGIVLYLLSRVAGEMTNSTTGMGFVWVIIFIIFAVSLVRVATDTQRPSHPTPAPIYHFDAKRSEEAGVLVYWNKEICLKYPEVSGCVLTDQEGRTRYTNRPKQ